MTDTSVTLAAITGAHGVAGEVRLKLFGEGWETLKAYDGFSTGDTGRTLTLTKIRSDNKGGAIARFAEIANRNEAEQLRGAALTVTRNALPELDDDEFYFSDLIGLPVITDKGDQVGHVSAVQNFGATDIIEIEKPDGKRFMVPITDQAVPEWDAHRLVVSAEFVES